MWEIENDHKILLTMEDLAMIVFDQDKISQQPSAFHAICFELFTLLVFTQTRVTVWY